MKQAYLECGKIINTHGFRGTVKLESRCDAPDILASLDTVWLEENGEYRALSVHRASVFKQFVLMDLEGVESEEAANRLRNRIVYAARESLPLEEGNHFIVDLIGLPVKDADDGALLGELIEINTNGATDLYIVRTATGDYMIPAVPQFIVDIVEDDAIYVRPIPGLLDGGAENV